MVFDMIGWFFQPERSNRFQVQKKVWGPDHWGSIRLWHGALHEVFDGRARTESAGRGLIGRSSGGGEATYEGAGAGHQLPGVVADVFGFSKTLNWGFA